MEKNGKQLFILAGLVILIMIATQIQEAKKEGGFINRYGYSQGESYCNSKLAEFDYPCKVNCKLITQEIYDCINLNNIMATATRSVAETLGIGQWNGLSLNSGRCSNLGWSGNTDEATLYQCF